MPKSEHLDGLTRADMEQMSTDSLEKLLLEDFRSSERGEADMSGLYMAAQELAERTPRPQAAVNRAWERFRGNYLPFAVMLREDGGSPSSDDAQRRRHSPSRRWPFRAALAAAVLCTLLLSVSAAAANGFNFLKALARWTDEQIWLAPGQIAPAGEDDIHFPEEGREYSGLQEALEDCGFTRPVVPQWVPEGYTLEELIVDDVAQCELLFHACYKRGEDSFVILICVYLDYEGRVDGNYCNFQKDEGDPVPYEAGGITHLLSTNAGRPVAVWANGPAECAFSGDITMEELTQMIDSIYQ